ncbi:class I SAM-dependent methyltransferase [Gordonia phthalatica]|uniref:SAM-dependent methyltransferase n=1 Tax=Gordonia phthalatica TaxID=1136941 RepID=A0A0N9N733_9ACTN|nr:class I SAM-dependent methyltransferase [Gordonia phthalatica]ALG86744.1 SAM-dependent methyltransferase [Gordonia phthalatica]
MTWFTSGGEYAAHRPTYPAEIVDVLRAAAPDGEAAVDIGCGTGQLTVLLAQEFEQVIGLDPSEDQIANATAAAKVAYRVSSAEALDVPDASASLITVAQAAHWFDLAAFYREVRRIAVPGAALALITYGVVELDDDLSERFDVFYRDEIGPYWPAERRHVDNRYADLDFPFEPIDAPAVTIERSWTLQQFAGYLGTWSAARRAREAGQGRILEQIADDLAPMWGDGRRTVRWPVTILLGRV